MIDMPRGNDENKWATFQDGTGKAAFSPFGRAHVLGVRSARQHKGVPLRDKLSNFALRDLTSYSRPCWTTFLTIPVSIGIEIF